MNTRRRCPHMRTTSKRCGTGKKEKESILAVSGVRTITPKNVDSEKYMIMMLPCARSIYRLCVYI